MTNLFELCRRNRHGIYAVPYHGGRPVKALRLPDGAIVESPLPDQRCEAPGHLDGMFAVAAGNVPATIHHANLGLIIAHLPLSGVFLLPSGDVAAVYGAEVVPIGAGFVPAT